MSTDLMMGDRPTQKLLREWLHYDPESGVFTWIKEPRANHPVLGKVAGTAKNGYWHVRIFGRQIGAHRLAWIYMNGDSIGELSIDHIDCNPLNNAICNLRLATPTQQQHNRRVRSDSRSGLKGAISTKCSGRKKWTAQITVGRRTISLGYFHTPEEAHDAYSVAAVEYFGEFARTA